MKREFGHGEGPQPGLEPQDAQVDQHAAVDDFLGGFSDRIGCDSRIDERKSDDFKTNTSTGFLNLMLLLRQTAASDGAGTPLLPTTAPRVIGRYTILELAGEGGFSFVYRGFDTDLRRPVAVKLRRPELLLSEAARRRFIREAQIAARLTHPHIVTIFEVGEDNGREFIAAEFCAGGSLADWLERHQGPIAPREAVRIVQTLAMALAYAHAAGVIHRDVKPSNVMLAPVVAGMQPLLPGASNAPGSGLTVKLGDFGLGKLQQQTDLAEPLTQLTQRGSSIGTPAWMAPEQIDESFGCLGPATDVHGLGLVLYRLVTGRSLRHGSSYAETYRQVLVDDPCEVGQLSRWLPRDLAAVTARCLKKKPVDRYATAQELADDLGRWLDGRPTVAQPVSSARRLARVLRRRPLITGLSLALLFAILVTGWTGIERAKDVSKTAEQEIEIRRQRAVTELHRSFESLRSGNVIEATRSYTFVRSTDPTLAMSLAGRWLVRRLHGEKEILLGSDPLAAAVRGTVSGATDAGETPTDFYSVVLSDCGESAAVAAADGCVYLIRKGTGTPSITAVHAHDEVNAIDFSPDGSLLATAGQDGLLRWWRVEKAGLVFAGEAVLHAGPIYAAAFSLDGLSIATGGEDCIVRIVHLAAPDAPKQLFRFEAPAGESPEIESAVFVDHDELAVSCGDSIVTIDPQTGSCIHEFQRPFEGNRNAVYGSLSLAPNRRQLIACGTDAKAHVWSLDTGKLVLSLPEHPNWVQGCGFSPDGTKVATACRDGVIRVFDATKGQLINRCVGHLGRVWAVVWETHETLLSAGADGTLRRWRPSVPFDVAAIEPMAISTEPFDEILTADPTLRQLDLGQVYCLKKGGCFWGVDVPRRHARWFPLPAGVQALNIDIDRAYRRIVISQANCKQPLVFSLENLFNGDDEAFELKLPAVGDPRDALAVWAPNGALVSCGFDGDVFWSPPDLSRLQRISSSKDAVRALVVAPAGPARVAICGKAVVIEPLPELGTTQMIAAHRLVLPLVGEATAVCWSPDAKVVACGTRMGGVYLFDASDGSTVATLAPHERAVEELLFSSDGSLVLSADRNVVRISDANTPTTFDEVRPGIRIQGLCLSAEEKHLFIAGTHADPDTAPRNQLLLLDLQTNDLQ